MDNSVEQRIRRLAKPQWALVDFSITRYEWYLRVWRVGVSFSWRLTQPARWRFFNG